MDARHKAAAIADAYAAAAKPPLTQELLARVRDLLADVLATPAAAGPDLLDRLNAALDEFETDLRSVVGPRIASLDDATGAVSMAHRSEAGQPLRAFGGQ